jgi:hypothetical protein
MVLKSNLKNKGMFFTIIAIFLLAFLLLVYSSYFVVSERRAVNKRIETMNNFVFSLEKDIPRQLYIYGYRAIFIFDKKIAGERAYMNNLNQTFSELFFNGTIYNEPLETDDWIIMSDARFPDIQNSINLEARKLNVNVTLSSPQVYLSQDDPWRVRVTLVTGLFIQDLGNLASWNRTASFSAYIPIESFEDPLYIVETNSTIVYNINRTIFSAFASGTNVSNLSLEAERHYYTNATAPSFLMRLEGDFNCTDDARCNNGGIESLVYLPELDAQGIIVKDKSCVDYIYFSDDNPDAKNIQGMPMWFKLDNESLDVYGVRSLAL